MTTAADLLAAVRNHVVRQVPGLGVSVETAIARALPGLRTNAPGIPLGRAVTIVEPLLDRLRGMAGVSWAEPAGSLRRGEDMVGDIEIVAPAADPRTVFDDVIALPGTGRSLYRSARRLYVLQDNVQIGIRCPAPEAGGAILLHLTGSPGHVDHLAAAASERGWHLEPDGLRRHDGTPPIASTEEEIYTVLGLPFVAPELREGDDELDAAAHGTLPRLVTRQDIRGDLHMHTDWSDGRDSIAAMARTAAGLGYEYIAITDHAGHSAASRNLTRDDVGRQAEAVAAARASYPQLLILHGCEVDILPEGTLDFPDRLLEEFDIVLASLHDRAGHGADRLLRRYGTAMRHPLVSIITHPTNRLVPHRAGYELDWDQVIAWAVETGTVLEVDGAPSHLDMDGPLARRAITAGAQICIDSDAHRTDTLGRQMDLGLTMARRGWVEPRHVVNSRPIADIRRLIAAKRSR
ncbi:MAG: PHP domain-containing protein [Luteitalea sp.]|nr:PHP domain-containing protein [Luteitalea sp.]